MGKGEGKEEKVRGQTAGFFFQTSLCAVPALRTSEESDSATDTEVFLNSSKMTN